MNQQEKADACTKALNEMGRMLDTYGDTWHDIAPGDLTSGRRPSRYLRVTSRGNVYDDAIGASVLHTWGMGTRSERRAIARRVVYEAADADYQARMAASRRSKVGGQ